MDKTQIVKWAIPVLARGVAWILAARLGMEAAEADTFGLAAAEAIGALVLIAVSVYTSVQGRRKLLASPPPAEQSQ